MTTNIQINPLTLRFPEELERIFFDDYFKKSLNQVRFALLLVLFILAISGILDQWTSPDFRSKALFFRYGLLFPVTLGFLSFTFSRLFKRFMQPAISLFIIIMAGSFIEFTIFVRNIDLGTSEVIIIILYSYTAIKLNFIYATLVGWTIAEAIAEMALDMQLVIARFSQELNETFSIRIGINTGPVVAGVIGLKKFIYDLWGDAVNTASRMESHGMANCIQVSQATYDLLRDKYLFEERGVIYVKGKGEMLTYLLTGRKVHQ